MTDFSNPVSEAPHGRYGGLEEKPSVGWSLTRARRDSCPDCARANLVFGQHREQGRIVRIEGKLDARPAAR